MAFYHLEAKIVTRGTGRTACGAAAYMSCSKIYNEYDGIQHDYTHKGGLVWEHIFLPPMAPAEWNDRETLWNAVEAAEKANDSRLAREFIAALPRELDAEAWKEILTEYIQDCFVSDGMCADVAIHDTDGHNPHAHILLTVRPLDEGGTWQYKTEKQPKELRVNKTLQELRKASQKNITTEHGIYLRLCRSIQVEGAFGLLKTDFGFRRFLTRGKTSVRTELFLLALAFDLKKLWMKRENGRLQTHLSRLSSA